MNQSINLRSITFLSAALITLLGYNYMSAQVWTQAPANPPTSNTAAPINVGPTMQAKTGNLAANILAATTEMRSNRYCDALGQNCFSPASTTGSGTGPDTITVGGRCFEPAKAVKCNWNWSGDGNDDSTYIIPAAQSSAAYCGTRNRSYVSEDIVLAECFASRRSWQASEWTRGTCSGQSMVQTCMYTRTVQCLDGNGQVRPNSECNGVAPATTCSAGILGTQSCPA